jgi:hypothetical protein
MTGARRQAHSSCVGSVTNSTPVGLGKPYSSGRLFSSQSHEHSLGNGGVAVGGRARARIASCLRLRPN